MKYYAIKYKQDKNDFFTTVLSFKTVNAISEALIYSKENKYGYQRELNEIHYKKIKNSIMRRNRTDIGNLVSPTSIVLGINRSDLNKLKIIAIKDDVYELDINEDNKIFRIIDGQHRLKGFELAAIDDDTLLHYQLNVIILIVEEGKRRIEVKAFSDINTKAKPLKMDLTILATYNYDLLEESPDINIDEHIAIRVAYKLNEYSKSENVWRNGIKLDVNSPKSPGIVGFKSFYESINTICLNTMRVNKNTLPDSFNDKIMYIDDISDVVTYDIIVPFWELVREKWIECFKKEVYFYNYEDYITFFDETYYIQKTMGVKSLHIMLKDCLENNHYDIDASLDKIRHILKNSTTNAEDWIIGGKFMGLSSESGFKKIAELISSNN
ncbi:MAG: hypothetical protein CVV02_05885 [Firmicutes bacterium HGW-Firmicutes-7]|nr:MAG: hypothetical protein CVV02_05885 [Firmicutes bacterium HGW-Firmicutes-7]